MTAIIIDNLQKNYGSVQALRGLNLSVPDGVIFGFLGPNGAGKSTTLRLLTGLAHPSGGSASIAGIPIGDQKALAVHIGYLPEEPAFYSWMTPVELLEYLGSLFHLPAQERKQRGWELLEQVGLAEVGKRRIGGFSRGMRQRLGLAQALLNRPEVLFLDEPVSALDPQGRKDVLEIIAALHGRCTVFMSTHILGDVERVCDSVGIIDHGQLVVEANRQELVERYSLPAFEIEVEHNGHDGLEQFAEVVEKQKYVTGISRTADVLRVLVNDVPSSRSALLALIDKEKLLLKRFELVTPTLEDIFLKLTNKEGASQ